MVVKYSVRNSDLTSHPLERTCLRAEFLQGTHSKVSWHVALRNGGCPYLRSVPESRLLGCFLVIHFLDLAEHGMNMHLYICMYTSAQNMYSILVRKLCTSHSPSRCQVHQSTDAIFAIPCAVLVNKYAIQSLGRQETAQFPQASLPTKILCDKSQSSG